MQNGVCSALTTLERHIKESAFGLRLDVVTWATPGVADADKVSRSQNQTSLSGQVRWPSPRATVLMEEAKQPDTPLSADWVEQLMGWPNGWTLPGPLFSACGPQGGGQRNTRGKRRG